MDFRLLVFKNVADHLSFTKASKALFISQPAVTRHINELEKQYEKALFNRLGNKISLTDEGELFLNYTNRILELYQELETNFQHFNKVFPKKIAMGASTTIAQYLLPTLFFNLRTKYPDTDFELLNDNSENIETLLLDKKISLGFTEGSASHPSIHYETFVKDEIVLVTKANNATLTETKGITIEQLIHLPLVMREEGSGTRKIIEQSLKANQIHPIHLKIDMILGSSESIKTYLLHSNSFAFLSIHSIAKELHSNKFRIIDIQKLDMQRVFYFATLHGIHTKAITTLKSFFKSEYKTHVL